MVAPPTSALIYKTVKKPKRTLNVLISFKYDYYDKDSCVLV